jgi:3-oxoacyl-[acyl-carrier protein] reductase
MSPARVEAESYIESMICEREAAAMDSSPKDLAGQVAIITGAASGIGHATARLCAEHGAQVAVFDILDEQGRAVVQELEAAGAKASYHHCDVRKSESVALAVSQVIERYGQIDVLVNVVGGSKLTWIWDMTEAEWDAILEFNLKSTFLCCRAVIPHMMERRHGAIVNIASGQGSTPAPQRSNYSAAKAGVFAFTRTIAAELAPHGIRANVVAPGATHTARIRAFYTDEEWVQRLSEQPTGRIADPKDIAEAIVFLASPRSRHIIGQRLHVNGGTYMP